MLRAPAVAGRIVANIDYEADVLLDLADLDENCQAKTVKYFLVPATKRHDKERNDLNKAIGAMPKQRSAKYAKLIVKTDQENVRSVLNSRFKQQVEDSDSSDEEPVG